MDLSGKLAQANGRLKSARVGVTIEQVGERLVLRATLPPKPFSRSTRACQQRIYLGVHANGHGLSVAESEARVIGALLDAQKFQWEPYLRQGSGKAETLGDWITQFEMDYFSKRARNDQTLTTWRGDYLKVLNRLPKEQALTEEFLRDVILNTEPDTKTRKRTCMVVGALARFAGLELEAAALSGRYNVKRSTPRDLPTDEEITHWYSKLKNPGWRWVYGMMACFGLRNHEVFRVDFDALRAGNPVLRVLEPTKTGERLVWPCYPEWFEQFNLSEVILPAINLQRPNEAVGRAVTSYLRDQFELPFKPYDLRHCWAVRTIEFLIPVELAAAQMGHSIAEHTHTYHRWIRADHQQRIFDALMSRTDRPQPPNLNSYQAN